MATCEVCLLRPLRPRGRRYLRDQGPGRHPRL